MSHAERRKGSYDGLDYDNNLSWLYRTGRCFNSMVSETGRKKGMNKEEKNMTVLGIIVLLLGCYLVYALVHPEKF